MRNDRTFWKVSRALGVTGLGAALLFTASCHHNSAAGQSAGQDPADANMAPVNGQAQVLGQNASYAPEQQGEAYPEGQQPPAPIVRGTPDQQYAAPPPDAQYEEPYYDDSAEQAGEEALEETDQAPPPLPEYEQPPAPGPDYIWTPGYWAWGPYGYYWVPGAWVEAPYYGALWTPPWWGWYGGRYRFHRGYWGPHVGFYGGIDYGFGYIGIGYFGGYWSGNHFYYNRAVTRIGGGIHNYYDRPVVYNNRHYGGQPSNRVSYNGGRGGINVQPRATELAAARERHTAPLATQRDVRTSASRNRSQFFNQNHGRPANAAETRGFANPHGVGPTPRGVQPGRPNTQQGRPNIQPGREASNVNNRGSERGAPGGRPNEVPRTNIPNANNGARGFNGAEHNNNPRGNERNGQPPHNQMAQPNTVTRPAPRAQQSAPQQRFENRPNQQPRVENRQAPQQQRMQNRPAPQQQHFQNRPAPQPRVQAQPHAQAPHGQNRPAPQPHGGGGPPQGGGHGGGEHGGGDHGHH